MGGGDALGQRQYYTPPIIDKAPRMTARRRFEEATEALWITRTSASDTCSPLWRTQPGSRILLPRKPEPRCKPLPSTGRGFVNQPKLRRELTSSPGMTRRGTILQWETYQRLQSTVDLPETTIHHVDEQHF